jgi:hypothetical protein
MSESESSSDESLDELSLDSAELSSEEDEVWRKHNKQERRQQQMRHFN